jgi:hypothetical protein
MGHDVDPSDERSPSCWYHPRREDADGGRLTRSVRSEQAEDLSPVDPQIEIDEGVAPVLVWTLPSL